jgi:type II secretory pathway component PulM
MKKVGKIVLMGFGVVALVVVGIYQFVWKPKQTDAKK